MNSEKACTLLSLLGDTNRLLIVVYLKNKLHANGNELLKQVNCKQATLSHHLSSMVEAGLLNSKKKGNQVIYSLNAVVFEQVVNFLGSIDRVNKNPEKPIRVTETKIITEHKEKEELPTYLL